MLTYHIANNSAAFPLQGRGWDYSQLLLMLTTGTLEVGFKAALEDSPGAANAAEPLAAETGL
eukprot:863635-Prorocentrum_lima.AAC.1